MESDIRYPVVVRERDSGDCFLCRTEGELAYMEPVDLLHGEYLLWDAEGYVVKASVEGTVETRPPILSLLGVRFVRSDVPVRFCRRSPLTVDAAGLRDALERIVGAPGGGCGTPPADVPLPQLLERALSAAGAERTRRDAVPSGSATRNGRKGRRRAILVYGVYLLVFSLLTGSMFIAAAEFFPLMALMLIGCSAAFVFTFLAGKRIVERPWLFLSFFLFLWSALAWGVLSVLEFYLPWMNSSGFSLFFGMMGN